MIIGKMDLGTGRTGIGFTYSEANKNILSLVRKSGPDGRQWNVYRTYGLVDGSGTVSEVRDDADIVKRGRIVYPAGLIGSPTMSLTQANSEATQALELGLRSKVDMEIMFNAFLAPGANISLVAPMAGINGIGTINSLTHTFSEGSHTTKMVNVSVLDV
jgi:hypothetical protein